MALKAYVLFKVSSGTEREICRKIAEFDEVSEANIIFGEYDLIAKVQAENLQRLEEFLTNKIRSIPTVILTSTMLVAREYLGKNERENKLRSKGTQG